MPQKAAVTKDELKKMLHKEELSHDEIAERVGLSVSRIRQLIWQWNLQKKKYGSRKDSVPWKVAKEHSSGGVVRYLYTLDKVAKQEDYSEHDAATAFTWAQEIVDQKMDIDYDKEVPPNAISAKGGFFMKPADTENPENWHLKKVLDRARTGRLRRR
jgi:transposase